MTGHIILCADDYGLSPGVSQAIRMLAAGGRISATSAMVTRPNWMREAEALKPLMKDIAVGLHLNLTLGAPLTSDRRFGRSYTFPGRARLILAALSGSLNSDAIATEIGRQLEMFEAGLGAAPDFVDGHEHVHVLPVVRKAVFETLQHRYANRRLLIRDPSITWSQIFSRTSPVLKSVALRVLARHMRRDSERLGFINNDRFGGITGFTPTAAAVAQDFSAAAALEGWRPLVMCHPGFPDAGLARIDRVTERRQLEFEALMEPSPRIKNIWRPERASNGQIQWPKLQSEDRA
jgi:chitin disaccharide deacetylase